MSETRRPVEGWPGKVSGMVALACLIYAAVVHHGLGAAPGGRPTDWWHPTGFLLGQDWLSRWHEAPWVGIALLTAPVATLLGLLYVRPAPAWARAAAATATASVAIMVFYGLAAYPIWSFFHWRGSAVMLASGLILGCTLAAPDLARSLRQRPYSLALALYVPAFFAVSSLIRNATGWDPALDFNISPWPAIAILALEIGAYTWVGVLAGLAIGGASFVFARTRARRAVGVAIGIVFPLAWFAMRFAATEPHMLMLGGGISAVMMFALLRDSRADHEVLVERVAALGVAAALVALPLATGRALADGDYTASKHHLARQIIDALATHYENSGEYPDSLDALVGIGLLESIPKPRVGFDFWAQVGAVDTHGFDYANLGSSYILEFVSTEWIMCSYNPPWDTDPAEREERFEDEVLDRGACLADCDRVCRVDCDDDVDDCDAVCGGACGEECAERASTAEAAAVEAGGEVWSCPDSRPELW